MNFFIGKVEDILDPLLTGRVKLRILGDHTDDKEILPTEDLPWATPLNDIHSHSTTGKGQTPLGVRIDTWVVGFYLDGMRKQRPVVLGSLPGEADVNTLATNTSEHISLTERKASRLNDNDEPIQIATPSIESKSIEVFGTTVGDIAQTTGEPWVEPEIPHNSIYPDNHVYESTNGHIMEFDDTIDETDPDKPIDHTRVHLRHRVGTGTEMFPDGDKVDNIKKDHYEIIDGSHYAHIKSNETITINGSLKVLINTDKGSNDYTIQIDDGGNCNIQVDDGQINLITGGDGNDINIHSSGDINMRAKQDVNIRALGNFRKDIEGFSKEEITAHVDIDASRIDLN